MSPTPDSTLGDLRQTIDALQRQLAARPRIDAMALQTAGMNADAIEVSRF
jgi:hypothetical protein